MFTEQTFTCSKLTIETLVQGVKYVESQQQRHWCHSHRPVVFNVKFEHIPHFFLMFLLLTLSKYLSAEFRILVNTDLTDFPLFYSMKSISATVESVETVEVIVLCFSTYVRRVSWTPARIWDGELCNKS